MPLRNYYLLTLFLTPTIHFAQETTVHGFTHTGVIYNQENFSFSLGEQDYFISSELNDKLTFLGESVFKYSGKSSTAFNVSLERIVLKYNYFGNHSILLGKHHTPIDYWNESFHHGRLFFPTIDRPKLFSFIPIHTTGISFQGQNLGEHNFGYDLMIGNGMTSSDAKDHDKLKSLTLSIHYKTKQGTQFRMSFYNDKIRNNISGAHTGHLKLGKALNGYAGDVNFQLYSISAARINSKFEFLNEFILSRNSTDSLGVSHNMAAFLYTGYRLKNLVPYLVIDICKIDPMDLHFINNNLLGFHLGLRYELNYLAAIKMEFIRNYSGKSVNDKFWVEKSVSDVFKLQFAIGF